MENKQEYKIMAPESKSQFTPFYEDSKFDVSVDSKTTHLVPLMPNFKITPKNKGEAKGEVCAKETEDELIIDGAGHDIHLHLNKDVSYKKITVNNTGILVIVSDQKQQALQMIEATSSELFLEISISSPGGFTLSANEITLLSTSKINSSIFAKGKIQINATKVLRMNHGTEFYSSTDSVVVETDLIRDMKGEFSAAENILLKFQEAHLKQGSSFFGNLTALQGNKLFCEAGFGSDKVAIDIKEKAIFEEKTQIHYSSLFQLKAPKCDIKCNIIVPTVQIDVKELVIFSDVLISAKAGLIQGDTLWNAGIIETPLIKDNDFSEDDTLPDYRIVIRMNKYVVHGLTEMRDLWNVIKHFKKHLARDDISILERLKAALSDRPIIDAEKIEITTPVFVNAAAAVKCEQPYVLTCVSRLEIFSFTLHKGEGISCLLPFDYGIELLNVPGLIKDIRDVFSKIQTGNYRGLIKQIFSRNTAIRAAMFARWTAKKFLPGVGEMIDFGISCCMFLANSMQFSLRLYALLKQRESIGVCDVIDLAKFGNGVVNQAVLEPALFNAINVGDLFKLNSLEQAGGVALVWDAATLLVPVTSKQAVFSAEGGINLNGSEVDQSVIGIHSNLDVSLNSSRTSYYEWSLGAEVGVNISKNSTHLAQKGTLIANYFSTTSYQERDSDTEHANTIVKNSTNLVQSGTVSANNFFTIGTTMTLDGNLTANTAGISAQEAHLENGHAEVKNLNLNVTHLDQAEQFVEGVGNYSNIHVEESLQFETKDTLNFSQNIQRDCAVAAIGSEAKISAAQNLQNDLLMRATAGNVEMDAPVQSKGAVALIADQKKVTIHDDLTAKSNYIAGNSGVEANKPSTTTVLSQETLSYGDAKYQQTVTQTQTHGPKITATDGDTVLESQHGDIHTVGTDIHSTGVTSFTAQGAVLLEGNTTTTTMTDQTTQKSAWGFVNTWLNQREQRDNKTTVTYSPTSITGSDVKFQSGATVNTEGVTVNAEHKFEEQSIGTYTNNQSVVSAQDVEIITQGDVINQASTLQGLNSLKIRADGDVINLANAKDVQGEFGPKKSYQQGYMLSGAGGTDIQARGAFKNIGSVVFSTANNQIVALGGIRLETLTNTFISDQEEDDGFWSSSSKTTYSTQFCPAELISISGGNILATEGKLSSMGATFISGGTEGTRVYGGQGVDLQSIVNQNVTIEHQGYVGNLIRRDVKEEHESAKPTVITDDKGDAQIMSKEEIDASGLLMLGPGKATFEAPSVKLSRDTLENDVIEDEQSLNFGIPILSWAKSAIEDPVQAVPIIGDLAALPDQTDSLGAGLLAGKMALDAYNAEKTISAFTRNPLDAAKNFIGIKLGFTETHSESHDQTLAPNEGVFRGGLAIKAQTVEFNNGVPIIISGDATIEAQTFKQSGASLSSSSSRSEESFFVGASLSGYSVGGGYQQTTTEGITRVNQQFDVGGKLTLKVGDWIQSDANVHAEQIEGSADDFTSITHTSTFSSKSSGFNLDTNGNVGFQQASVDAALVDAVSGIDIDDGINSTDDGPQFTVKHTKLIGSVIRTSGINKFATDTLDVEGVKESVQATSISFSGNVNDLNFKNKESTDLIPLWTGSYQRIKYQAEELPNIHGEKGTTYTANTVQGVVNTSANHTRVDEDKKVDYRMAIPLGPAKDFLEKTAETLGIKEVTSDPLPTYLTEKTRDAILTPSIRPPSKPHVHTDSTQPQSPPSAAAVPDAKTSSQSIRQKDTPADLKEYARALGKGMGKSIVDTVTTLPVLAWDTALIGLNAGGLYVNPTLEEQAQARMNGRWEALKGINTLIDEASTITDASMVESPACQIAASDLLEKGANVVNTYEQMSGPDIAEAGAYLATSVSFPYALFKAGSVAANFYRYGIGEPLLFSPTMTSDILDPPPPITYSSLDQIRNQMGEQTYYYAVKSNGSLVIAPQKLEQPFKDYFTTIVHPELVNSEPVLTAGAMDVTDGYLTAFDNGSPHYMPIYSTEDPLKKLTTRVLVRNGFDEAPGKFNYMDDEANQDPDPKRAWDIVRWNEVNEPFKGILPPEKNFKISYLDGDGNVIPEKTQYKSSSELKDFKPESGPGISGMTMAEMGDEQEPPYRDPIIESMQNGETPYVLGGANAFLSSLWNEKNRQQEEQPFTGLLSQLPLYLTSVQPPSSSAVLTSDVKAEPLPTQNGATNAGVKEYAYHIGKGIGRNILDTLTTLPVLAWDTALIGLNAGGLYVNSELEKQAQARMNGRWEALKGINTLIEEAESTITDASMVESPAYQIAASDLLEKGANVVNTYEQMSGPDKAEAGAYLATSVSFPFVLIKAGSIAANFYRFGISEPLLFSPTMTSDILDPPPPIIYSSLDQIRNQMGEQTYYYAVKSNGSLVIAPQKLEQPFKDYFTTIVHPELVNSEPVVTAGTMHVTDGYLTDFDNRSPHYMPGYATEDSLEKLTTHVLVRNGFKEAPEKFNYIDDEANQYHDPDRAMDTFKWSQVKPFKEAPPEERYFKICYVDDNGNPIPNKTQYVNGVELKNFKFGPGSRGVVYELGDEEEPPYRDPIIESIRDGATPYVLGGANAFLSSLPNEKNHEKEEQPFTGMLSQLPLYLTSVQPPSFSAVLAPDVKAEPLPTQNSATNTGVKEYAHHIGEGIKRNIVDTITTPMYWTNDIVLTRLAADGLHVDTELEQPAQERMHERWQEAKEMGTFIRDVAIVAGAEVVADVAPTKNIFRSEIYQDAVRDLAQDGANIVNVYGQMSGPEKAEAGAYLLTSFVFPYSIIKGMSMLSNYRNFGMLAHPPLFVYQIAEGDTPRPVLPFERYSFDAIRNTPGDKDYLYVIKNNGDLVISPVDLPVPIDGLSLGVHGDLADRKPVITAGNLIAENGYITAINNVSGHYAPTGNHLEDLTTYVFNREGFTEANGKFRTLGVSPSIEIERILLGIEPERRIPIIIQPVDVQPYVVSGANTLFNPFPQLPLSEKDNENVVVPLTELLSRLPLYTPSSQSPTAASTVSIADAKAAAAKAESFLSASAAIGADIGGLYVDSDTRRQAQKRMQYSDNAFFNSFSEMLKSDKSSGLRHYGRFFKPTAGLEPIRDTAELLQMAPVKVY